MIVHFVIAPPPIPLLQPSTRTSNAFSSIEAPLFGFLHALLFPKRLYQFAIPPTMSLLAAGCRLTSTPPSSTFIPSHLIPPRCHTSYLHTSCLPLIQLLSLFSATNTPLQTTNQSTEPNVSSCRHWRPRDGVGRWWDKTHQTSIPHTPQGGRLPSLDVVKTRLRGWPPCHAPSPLTGTQTPNQFFFFFDRVPGPPASRGRGVTAGVLFRRADAQGGDACIYCWVLAAARARRWIRH